MVLRCTDRAKLYINCFISINGILRPCKMLKPNPRLYVRSVVLKIFYILSAATFANSLNKRIKLQQQPVDNRIFVSYNS